MADNDDIKAKMREALDRKKPHDPGVEHADHHEGGGKPSSKKGGDKQFRRKAGG